MTSHRLPGTPEQSVSALSTTVPSPASKPEPLGPAAVNGHFLDLLSAEYAAAGQRPAPISGESDYFLEASNPDQLIGATAIASWRFRAAIVTDALRKKVYYENQVWGEDAGYHRVGKNRIALWKSKYRAFRARMNGGVL